ncbi:MAG: hypothetical protein D6767_04300 [Candidatus Hydrogenedentota bacterium]|nr:MAG: hypothetical protein D6767_04300 [Candidatus Hydrogenedentota bacterium]
MAKEKSKDRLNPSLQKAKNHLNLAKRPLHIAGGKPMSEAFLNVYFKVFSAEQLLRFEDLFLSNKKKLDELGISGEKFMEMIRESYERYQKFKKLDPFTPMDKKGEKYVRNYLQETIDKVHKNVQKARQGK